MTDRINGVVKFFLGEKGYGFISPADGGTDIFVHKTALPAGVDGLKQDQKVSYVPAVSDRKKGDSMMATKVKVD